MSVKSKLNTVKTFGATDWGVVSAAWFGLFGMLMGVHVFFGGVQQLTTFQSYILGSVWMLGTPVVFVLMVESITNRGK